MRAIADKLIPGIAENLRILLVDQVEDNQAALLQGDDADVEVDLTVLQRVVKSDRLRERNLKEFSGNELFSVIAAILLMIIIQSYLVH